MGNSRCPHLGKIGCPLTRSLKTTALRPPRRARNRANPDMMRRLWRGRRAMWHDRPELLCNDACKLTNVRYPLTAGRDLRSAGRHVRPISDMGRRNKRTAMVLRLHRFRQPSMGICARIDNTPRPPAQLLRTIYCFVLRIPTCSMRSVQHWEWSSYRGSSLLFWLHFVDELLK